MKAGFTLGQARSRLIAVAAVLACGLAFLIVTPPFQSPDEPAHFARIMQLSQLEILGSRDGGSFFPAPMFDADRPFTDLRFNGDRKLKVSQLLGALEASPRLEGKAASDKRFTTVAYVLVSPLPYLHEAIVVGLGRLFAATPLELLYLARLVNLLVGVFLVALALRALEFSPRLWLATLILAAIPMNVFLMATANCNSNVNLFAVCLAAFGAALRQKFNRRQFAWFLVFAMAMSVSKSIYFALPLAVIPFVWSQTRDRKTRWRRIALIVAASILPSLVWTLFASRLYLPLREGVDPKGALLLALHQPLVTLHTIAESTKFYYTFYKETFVGRVGWHDTSIPYRVVKHYFHALYLVAFLAPAAGIERPVRKLQGLWVAAIAAATAALTYGTIFLTWNPVGSKVIEGVQGRHFLPVAPFFFLAAWPVLKLRRKAWTAWSSVLLGGWAAALAITLYCTVTRYWSGW